MASLDILFHTIRNDMAHILGGRTLFMNARYHNDISILVQERTDFYQSFKVDADVMSRAGFDVRHDLPEHRSAYDAVLIDIPHNVVHTRYLIACALGLLKEGGVLVCAGDNNAGGKRLVSIFKEFGLPVALSSSRDKARCVVAVSNGADRGVIEAALSGGGVQPILEGAFTSQPGVFGWDKIDQGSHILTDFIPTDLSGSGADFGCGYGYLSRFVLNKCQHVKHLYCIDADYRALALCENNLQSSDCDVSLLWRDLTCVQPDLQKFDFVVMNPPFHIGKKTDVMIGKLFIETASSVLKKRGRLFMVSNAHLAYEDVLDAHFEHVIKHHEAGGFKVHEAIT